MPDKYVLIEYVNPLNDVIKNTFQDTTRIKFTCFDVSVKYVVFGASTGGIYVFSRGLCQFLKLIPSIHGSVTLLAISENEQHIAVATLGGLILVLENCFTEDEVAQNIYSEDDGRNVTAIKWNGNDVYFGDKTGKVSVITLKSFLGKTIFYPPVTTIMYLEASIVQIDVFSKLLLVSTTTRTVLCDTEAEHFRQIGSKKRDGIFGSCFLSNSKPTKVEPSITDRRIFRKLNQNEKISSNFKELRIYCARPGARLWEVDSQGEVLLTLQFRGSLYGKQSDIIHIDEDDLLTRLNIPITSNDVISSQFKFKKIYNITDKFILTYDKLGFYVFDPHSHSLLFWSGYFQNVKNIKISNSYLYIWHDSMKLSTVYITTLENLIAKTFIKQQYLLCADLCLHFREDIEGLSSVSKKIQYIKGLENCLKDVDMLEKVKPVIEWIKEHTPKAPSLARHHNGIVSINNPFVNEMAAADRELHNLEENYYSNKTQPINQKWEQLTTKETEIEVGNYRTLFSPLIQDNSIEFALNPNLEISVISETGQQEKKKLPFDILLDQYRISKINPYLETSAMKELIKTLSLKEFYHQIQNIIINFAESEEEEFGQSWCKEMFLKILSRVDKKCLNDLRPEMWDYAIQSFLDINSHKELVCNCGFPLSQAHNIVPHYSTLGPCLFERFNDYDYFTKVVPYAYRYILEKIDDIKDAKLSLPLIIQFSDLQLIEQSLQKATYDDWDDACRLVTKLRKGVCLYCDQEISIEGAVQWKDFAPLIVQSIDATNANKILQRYANLIPKGELDQFFYQFAILHNAATGNQSETKRVKEEFLQNKEELNSTTYQFLEDATKKKLSAKATGKRKSFPVFSREHNSTNKCNYCHTILTESLYDKYEEMPCSHKYHARCLRTINNHCSVCDSD